MLPNRDKIRGMFLGIAIGDALGMPVETYSAEKIKGQFGFIDRYVKPADDHKWFAGREAGTWTDDTQLSLVVAESLIAKGKIDMDDMAARHVAALNETDLGWGASTREAVQRLAAGVHWSESGKTDKSNRGKSNGVAMKVAPVGAWIVAQKIYWKNFEGNVIGLTRMTHQHKLATQSTFAQIGAIIYCLDRNANNNLQAHGVKFSGFLDSVALFSDFDFSLFCKEKPKDDDLAYLITDGHFPVEIPEIINIFSGGTSYVYSSLPFSYAFFLRHPTSIQSLYEVVSAGGDTDTNGSIVGSLLGALNGASIFPPHLIDGLWQKDRILDTAERFCDQFGIAK